MSDSSLFEKGLKIRKEVLGEDIVLIETIRHSALNFRY